MRAILATFAGAVLLALVALPAALGGSSKRTDAVFSASLRATSRTAKVVTVKNLGTIPIVELIVEAQSGFAIKAVKSPPAGGSCGRVSATGKYTNVDCKTKLAPGKSTTITLETKQQGSGPVRAQVGARTQGAATLQAKVVVEGK